MDRDAAEQAFGDFELVLPFTGDVAKHANCFTRDFAADAIAGEHQDIDVHERGPI
jgi:hypothetical protein